MSRPSALPRTPPRGTLHYPHLETLLEGGEDEDDDEYHPRLDGEDDGDHDETEDVITVPPSTGLKPSTNSKSSLRTSKSSTGPNPNSSSASLNDIKKLMKEMEERHDKFLDKALDELQGTVPETFSKFNDRLSSL